MGDWTVRWRAVAIDGVSPDKWGAVVVSGKIATSAAHAIYLVQTQHDDNTREKLPDRAFVDWHATDELVVRPQRELAKFDSPEAKEWKADVIADLARRAAWMEL